MQPNLSDRFKNQTPANKINPFNFQITNYDPLPKPSYY